MSGAGRVLLALLTLVFIGAALVGGMVRRRRLDATIRQALCDPDPTVRAATANLLARSGGARMVETLRWRLNVETDDTVLQAVRSTLEQFDPTVRAS